MRDLLANTKELQYNIDFYTDAVNENIDIICKVKEDDKKGVQTFPRVTNEYRIYNGQCTVAHYCEALIDAKYSGGRDLSEIEKDYQLYMKMFRIVGYGIGYGRLTTLLALSILFEAPKEDLELFVKVADEEKYNQFIFDYMVKGCGFKRKKPSTKDQEKYHKFSTDIIEIVQTDHKKASETFVKYMSKKWFKDRSGSWGKDVHLQKYYLGFWAYEAAAIAKILNLDDGALKADNHYPYELRHYKNGMTFTPSKMLDIPTESTEYTVGIPKFPKLEQVVAPPFHETINQLIIDFKELSDLKFYEKYELDDVWHKGDEYDDYVKRKNEHGFYGFMIIKTLIECGQVVEMDARDPIDNYLFENFWGDVPVKFVCFDLNNDEAYYSYIPQSSDLKIIFDVKIEDIHMGLLEQGGLDMEM